MKDSLHPLHRALQGLLVHDVPGRRLELDSQYGVEPRRLANEQPQLVAALRKRLDEMRAEEPGAAGDECLAHRG